MRREAARRGLGQALVVSVRPSYRPRSSAFARVAHESSRVSRKKLASERQVPLSALRLRVVEERGLAVRRRLAQPDVSRDHRLEYVEVAFDLVGHLMSEIVSRVEHRQHDALDLEPRG